jgi:membrane-associated phospholipid phosphatase
MKALLRRALVALALLAVMITGYRLIGFAVEPGDARELRLAIDDAIPFWSWSVYLYSWVYTSMLYPAFVVRSPRLFRRIVVAYAVVIVVSLLCFAFLPVSAVRFRPDVSSLDTTAFHEWAVRLTYFVDPPYNLFPSLHLSIATLAALSAWTARRLFGALAFPIVAGIAVSICTMKQHYVVDGVAALVLATATWALVVRPFRGERPAAGDAAYSWRGPLVYLGFHALVYLGFYVAFRLGFTPWTT